MAGMKAIKAKKPKLKRTEKKLVKGRLKNSLMFLPNMVRLCGNLLIDKRVPITEKALFAAAIVYAISPIDFIPDVFPFIGQIDDLYLISLTLLRLFNYTDESVVKRTLERRRRHNCANQLNRPACSKITSAASDAGAYKSRRSW